ncbi:outer membrane protein [Rhodopseudomonas palustris HaA2]|uniref:Outer membrane protein n=1 Tax=Rhodopseudomonas palustris (strain HaA2) TaxID=316058 RepID=Q2IYR1_RHOP2|nr:outer membrane beta-barrel protein [Rhodopseudomonas palustris]ABD06649.1 outer membrane protein [Rhodopseudomonas palustris HaA2]
MAQLGYGFAVLVVACGLGSSMALAADMAMKAPVKAVPYAPSPSWTGLYVGGHLGGGWVDETATFVSSTSINLIDPLGTSYPIDHSGFLGGVQAGYNYQIQNWVIGIAGDFSWTSAKVDTVTASLLVPGAQVHTQAKTDWYATATGRVGYAFGNLLAYGKGGAAWIHSVHGGFADFGAAGIVPFSDVTTTRAGWTVGVGLEWAFAPHWSVFGEYNYMDFGTRTYTFTNLADGGSTSNFDVKTSVSLVKAGVNYRF